MPSTTLDDAQFKKKLNRTIFDIVAPKYDWLTRPLSFWRDKAWKKELLQNLPVKERPVVFDLACGTGDLTEALRHHYSDALILGGDLTPAMLLIAKARAVQAEFSLQNMGQLAINSSSVDVLTGGYALRNAPNLEQTVAEIARVLKPGGIAAFLDFSRSPSFVIFKFHFFLLWMWGSLFGLLLHGKPFVYNYIALSLAHYPNRNALHALLESNGLPLIKTKRKMAGMVELIWVQKT